MGKKFEKPITVNIELAPQKHKAYTKVKERRMWTWEDMLDAGYSIAVVDK